MPDFPVILAHPDVDGTTHAATRTSLRALQARGWRPVEPDDLSSKKRQELDDLARAAGLEPSDYRTKSDLTDAIATAQTPDA